MGSVMTSSLNPKKLLCQTQQCQRSSEARWQRPNSPVGTDPRQKLDQFVSLQAGVVGDLLDLKRGTLTFDFRESSLARVTNPLADGVVVELEVALIDIVVRREAAR